MNLESIKLKWHHFKNKISNKWMSAFRSILIISILIKTNIFLITIDGRLNDITSFKLSFVYLMFIVLISSFGYLFSYNKQIIYYNIFNILYTMLLIIDLGYYRANGYLLGLRNVVYPETFNIMGGQTFIFKIFDILFILDIVLMIAWIISHKMKNYERRSIIKFATTFIVATLGIFTSYIVIDVLNFEGTDVNIFKESWKISETVRGSGPIGYHGYEAIKTLKKVLHNSKEEEVNEIDEWLLKNYEDLPDNKYKGIYKGKNVIFLQVESLENFVINKETNGKEITPNLNKLIEEGLYFSNIYEQNNGGNSIDADFIVNTSILSLGNTITALDYSEIVYPNSIQRVLNSEGYKTVTTQTLQPSEYNWGELHVNGFGASEIWPANKYIFDEYVGYGLSDKSFFTQLSSKLDTIEEPFFIHATTLTSHGPFDIKQEYRVLDLPKEIDDSYLGGYFESIRYTDEQIGMFVDMLDAKGLLDDTMIVIYGDHGGVHKYYNEDIKDLSYEDDWWKEYTKEIPLIIYTKDGFKEEFNVNGGHLDIAPTVLYLLGVKDSKYRKTSMGRVLVNTDRNATVIKGNIIKGDYKNEEEKNHLLKAYEMGEMIIENNYFKYKINNIYLSLEE